ncbi:MAG: DUF362 domain-containing protein [Chloroflexota bacterium]
MTQVYPNVSLVRRDNRRDNVYGALDLVRDDVVQKLRPQVMLKPNFLSGDNQLASSHVDVARGTIDFLMSTPNPPEEILIAEGGNEKYSGQAFDNFGYRALLDEYDVPIKLIDLNQETKWEEETIYLVDGSPYTVHMPKTVLDCPCTISMAIAKTHDTCVVTLALKNMIMGTIQKIDRVKMHGFASHHDRKVPDESKVMHINLIRLARHLAPDISVIDGTVGLQGNGPGGTDAIDLGVATAGVDVFAVDAVMTSVMGFDPLKIGLSVYGNQLGMGIADLEKVNILGTTVESVRQSFKPHETTELQLQWQHDQATELMAV